MSWMIAAGAVMFLLGGGKKDKPKPKPKPKPDDDLSWIDDLEELDEIFDDD